MPIFLIFLLFVIWFAFARKRSNHILTKKADNFWEKESIANNTRKTSLEYLDYITIPLNLIKLAIDSNDSILMEYGKTLEMLSNQKIVNLTGITNTELKLNYGSSNLPILMGFDQNFTVLAQTLNKAGARFNELGDIYSAIEVLEFAIACGSDISTTYKLLSKLYRQTGQTDKIEQLIQSAHSLHSLMKDSILKYLE